MVPPGVMGHLSAACVGCAEVTGSSTLDGPAHAAAHAPQQQNGVAHHEVRVLLYGGFSGGGIDGIILSINPGMKFYFPDDTMRFLVLKQVLRAHGVWSAAYQAV